MIKIAPVINRMRTTALFLIPLEADRNHYFAICYVSFLDQT